MTLDERATWCVYAMVGCIGSMIGFVFVVLSLAFAPVVWLYGKLGGRK